ncbi:MAG: DUF177 domain-containing protein [Acidimicrobiia bacterium]|nr:MAG: DUF177 domain-containing protein [Acidimicrobiia bacterium]
MERGSPFRFPVSDLLSDPGSRRRVSIDAPIDWPLELSVAGPAIHAEIVLQEAAGGILVRATASTTVHHTCHRCLTEWDETMAVSIDEPMGVGDDEDEYPILGEVVDLEPPLRDAVLLEITPVPTCRPECLGLCAVCGADLNTGPCPGHDEEPDSPFASLRGLLET